MRSLTVWITRFVLAVLLCPASAWAWGLDGHKIVAVIAADNLTPAAQSHVANILGVPADRRSIAAAMEAASIRPDTEFRDEDSRTAPWHFIDICLQDRRADVPARCPNGNCVTGKIDEYSKRLKERNYDRWGAKGDLAFLIHFVGDVHQPLHTANDADRGGNCVTVDSRARADNLHYVWDTTVVRGLEYRIDSGRPETTAHKLEQTYAAERDADSWIARGRYRVGIESSGAFRHLRCPANPNRAVPTHSRSLSSILRDARSNWTLLIWTTLTRSRAISWQKLDSGWRVF